MKLFEIPLVGRLFGVQQPKNFDIVNEAAGDLTQISQGHMWELVSAIRQIQSGKKSEYDLYDEMAKDAIVESAIELMADDATQTDEQHNHCVWIESSDTSLVKELEDFLYNDVNIDTAAWTYAYEIIKYGEMYLNTFHDEKYNPETETPAEIKDRWYFEPYPDPRKVSAIIKFGETQGSIS